MAFAFSLFIKFPHPSIFASSKIQVCFAKEQEQNGFFKGGDQVERH